MSVLRKSRPADEDLVAQARERAASPLDRRDRAASLVIGGGFLATAVTIAALLPWHRPLSLGWAAALVLAYAVASRVEFPAGPGFAVPTQLVLVPMLFLLPAPVVPLAVAGGYAVAALGAHVAGTLHRERLIVPLTYSWHAVGPAVVLSLGTDGTLRWTDWPIYAAALAAQVGFDLASSTARDRFVLGVGLSRLLPVLAWVYAIDVLLAPIALLVACAAMQFAGAFALTFSLVALLALLARERKGRIDRAIELDEAYRGASREARSDPLTGVCNRLGWDEAIAAEEVRDPSRRPVSIVLVDVNGLKVANDTLGHDAGDRMLRTLAAIVRAAVPGAGAVARVGGDEFAVLLPQTPERVCREIVARLAEAIDLHPPVAGVRLSAAVGYAACRDGESLAETQQRADRRMYGQKRAARLARSRQLGTDLLLSALRARSASLDEHGREVAMLARAVGKRLGMLPDELDELTRTAELHDLGKIAVPDAILEKPGALTDAEWDVVCTHPAVGARILEAAPPLRRVASAVRATHERYDGRGYPDGLAGEEIPLAARIVFVCDAFDAMTSRRPYRPAAMTVAEAIAELRHCARTQFDPAIVEHLCDVVAAEPVQTAAARRLSARITETSVAA